MLTKAAHREHWHWHGQNCSPRIGALRWGWGSRQGVCLASCCLRTRLRGFGQGHETGQKEQRGKSERDPLIHHTFRNIMNRRVGAGETLYSNTLFLDLFSECTQSRASALENSFSAALDL